MKTEGGILFVRFFSVKEKNKFSSPLSLQEED